MAELTPGGPYNDPLDDRLRATFSAEHADVERRHLATGSSLPTVSPLRWIPFAAAAALIAIAGFLFIGNRSTDTAVDIGVAAQTESGTADGGTSAPVGVPPLPTPVRAPTLPVPLTTPVVPFTPNECDQPAIPVVFVWDIDINDPDGGLVAHTEPDIDAPVTRILRLDEVVSPTGVCRLSPTGAPWFQLINQNGSRDWASARFLNGDGQPACLQGEQFGTRTRAGGRLTHYVAAGETLGAIAQQYGIDPNELISANPALDPNLLLNGEPIWIPGLVAGPERVSGPLSGLAIVDGDRTALAEIFTPGGSTTYRWFATSAIEIGNTCPGDVFSGPPPPVAVEPFDNGCGESPVIFPLRFVWGVDAGDPDGGLLAHTGPGVDAPVTRVIQFNEVVALTGGCEFSLSGSPWYELRREDGTFDWVSGNFVAEATLGCLNTTQQDGLAVPGPDGVAFAPSNASQWQLYDSSEVSLGSECFNLTGTSGPACLYGSFRVSLPNQIEPIFTGEGPQQVELTGRTFKGATVGIDAIEVSFGDGNGAFFVGLVDPFFTTIEPGACVPIADGSDQLLFVPCNATDSEVVTGSAERGSSDSNADYVRNIRVDQSGSCTRIVLELGNSAEGSTADLIPLIEVFKSERSTRIWLPEGSLGDAGGPDRVDFPNGTALIATIGVNQNPVVDVLYGDAGPVNVWFLQNPARVIIDHLAPPVRAGTATQPFGSQFVLRQPIQTEIFGPGLPAGEPIRVSGYGRPFEASGLYRIYALDAALANPLTHFDVDRTPLHEGLIATSGWIDGWGEFVVTLPALEPGTYIALFGEAPPGDDGIDFVGSGQQFHIVDPAGDGDDQELVPAELLPLVRIDS